MLEGIKIEFRETKRIIQRRRSFSRLNNMRPLIKKSINVGRIVVLLGSSGAGKSFMAQKILPNAFVFPGDQTNTDKYDGEKSLILDETQLDIVRSKKALMSAMSSGRDVIIVSQEWSMIAPLLNGLKTEQYCLFSLNESWGVPCQNLQSELPIPSTTPG